MNASRLLATFAVTIAHAQTQVAILTPSDGCPEDYFGWVVDVQGDMALVGAPRARGAGPSGPDYENPGSDPRRGSVYVFEPGPDGWTETQRIASSDLRLGDHFGAAVALDGDWAVIGAAGHLDAGAAYLFERTSGIWVERQRFVGKFPGGHFGGAVAIQGDRVLVGAPHAGWVGRITVIERSAGVWAEVETFQGFAGALDLDGDRAIGGRLTAFGGEAAIYLRTSGGWVKEQPLGGNCCHSLYARAVLLRGTFAIVGDPYNASAPFIERFDFDGVLWQALPRIYQPEPLVSAFGYSLDEDAGLVVVGDTVAGPSFDEHNGAAYLFRKNGVELDFAGKVTASDGGSEWFGLSTAISVPRVLVGAPFPPNDASGRAFVFEVFPDIVLSCVCQPVLAPCGNDYSLGGCDNSREFGALLGASGSASVSSDDLVLSATQLPRNQFGLIFMGDQLVAPAPLADGLRCVGGNLFRFPARATGPGGVFDEGPGLVSDAAGLFGLTISSGQTWHFQAWARDPAGPCGLGSNTSNALSVTFVP